MSNAESFPAGSTFAERYNVLEPLGEGSMGFVLKVEDTQPKPAQPKVKALKILFPHHTGNDDILNRFKREYEITKDLTHPNIVRFYDYGEYDQEGEHYHFISMEYLPCKDLGDHIKAGTLTFPEKLKILKEASRAIHYAHNHKSVIVHRDITPANILVLDDGSVRVTDFGIAKPTLSEDNYTKTGLMIGTEHYTAPENFYQAKDAEPRSDIYSLGIIAYEIVVGTQPFQAEMTHAFAVMHMQEPIPAFAKKHDVPKWYEDMVFKAAAKEPDDRFQSALALADHIESREGSSSLRTYIINVIGFVILIALFLLIWRSIA